ncbi:MAG: GTP-binding protein [Candidatus Hodarchaeales archaeon]
MAGKTQRTTISLVTLGHVDHGKSTTMGRFLAEIGVVDPRTLEKNLDEAASLGMEEWGYAYALDSLPEERERGLTSDIAFQPFQTETQNMMLIDAPGHRDYVSKMISGAAISDSCILMVSAEPGDLRSGLKIPEGKSPGGQTREHAIIGSVLGIQQVIVCINKMDLVDYSEKGFQEAVNAIKKLLKQIQSPWIKKNIPFIPISGREGTNLASKPEVMPWYAGPTLLETLDTLEPPTFKEGLDLRFLVQDSYDIPGTGLVLQGRVVSGILYKDTNVVLLPGSQQVKVREIYNMDEDPIGELSTGNYGLVSLKGFSKENLIPGIVLAPTGREYKIPELLKVRLLVLDSAPKPLIKGNNLVLHVAMGVTTAVIEDFVSLDRPTAGSSKREKVFFARPGEVATVMLSLDSPLVTELSIDNTILGRVLLRDMGNTVAVGLLIQ